MRWFGKRTPYNSIPFGQFSADRLLRLLKKDINESIKRLKVLAASPEPATFMNTILELESIKELANRYFDIYAVQNAVARKDNFTAINDTIYRQLGRYQEFLFVPEIFARIEKVFRTADVNLLTEQDESLILYYYNLFVKEGINLTSAQRVKLDVYEKEIQKLGDKYTNNLIKLQESSLKVRERDQLQGVSNYFLNVAKKDARKNAYDGYMLRVNDNAYKEVLKFCDNRMSREKVYSMHYNVEHNKYLRSNEQIGRRMLKLRNNIARMHNHRNFSDFILAFNSVPNYTQLGDIFQKVKKQVAPRIKKLTAEVKRYAFEKDQITNFSEWDFDYYLHQMKIKKYGLNEQKIAEYFPLDHVKKETFKILKKMFGLTFKKVSVPLFHKDAEAYRVFKGKEELGLVYMDLYDRPDKELVPFCMSIFDAKVNDKSYALLSCNFNPPVDTMPSLLSYEDVRTLFHELGHLIHVLFSKVDYMSVAGFNVSKDFEEVPSLFLEKLVEDPEVFLALSRHYKTRKPLSRKLVKSLQKFNRLEKLVDVFSTLKNSLLDAQVHRASLTEIKSFSKFEQTVLKDLELFTRRKGDAFLTNFEHLFNSSHEGSYYSYLWSDIIKEDLWAQFKDQRSRRSVANRLVEHVFSKGASVSELEQVRRFKKGRSMSLTPFLKSIKMP